MHHLARTMRARVGGVEDHVVLVERRAIAPRTAGDAVAAPVARPDRIRAAATAQHVASGAADEAVTVGAAAQRVVAGAAVQAVPSTAPEQQIAAAAAAEPVAPRVAAQHVRARGPRHVVAAAVAAQLERVRGTRPRRARQHDAPDRQFESHQSKLAKEGRGRALLPTQRRAQPCQPPSTGA